VLPESIEMSTFLSTCLYIFAACAALGLLPAAVLAARARQPAMVVLSLIVAGFVVFVLVAAAGELPRH
jgi:spore maturation protein SpmA